MALALRVVAVLGFSMLMSGASVVTDHVLAGGFYV